MSFFYSSQRLLRHHSAASTAERQGMVNSKFMAKKPFSNRDFHLVNSGFPRATWAALLKFLYRNDVPQTTEVTYEKTNRTRLNGLFSKCGIRWRWVIHRYH
ncbi:hypothetical protein THOD03_150061 [Vibrio harveyi]|nr:hypothetical protein THOD03_150061 [Vibrio harveyi]